MGICNGFQILTEAHLLPGALIRNIGLKFVCRYVDLRVENAGTPFTQVAEPGDVLRVVVKHNEGNYRVDPDTLARLRDNGQIVLRYCAADGSEAGERGERTIGGSSPNGSLDDIAGVCNEDFNVFGLMPHPENSVEAGLAGGTDGRVFFQSIIDSVRDRGRPDERRPSSAAPASKPPSSSASRADEYAHICSHPGARADLRRARHLLAHVERALQLQALAPHPRGASPPSGPRILQGPGENAGIIDVGDGWAVAMKVESHNHPSAVEPFQGAATGVGGIVRDIFTMGARPCVSLDSLRFGEIDGAENARQRFLFDGVVGGIGFYGNCLGIPTVGGEIYFETSYEGNCLVNAMSRRPAARRPDRARPSPAVPATTSC